MFWVARSFSIEKKTRITTRNHNNLKGSPQRQANHQLNLRTERCKRNELLQRLLENTENSLGRRTGSDCQWIWLVIIVAGERTWCQRRSDRESAQAMPASVGWGELEMREMSSWEFQSMSRNLWFFSLLRCYTRYIISQHSPVMLFIDSAILISGSHLSFTYYSVGEFRMCN